MTVSREETQARINRFFGAIRQPLPGPNWTVMDSVEKLVAEQADHPCLIYQDRSLSYGALDDMAARYAALARQCGLKAGDVAAVMIENRPEFFAAWMGLAKIGVTTALINTQALNKALEHAIRETRCKMLFLGAECLGQFAATDMCAKGELRTFVIPDDAPLPSLPVTCTDLAPALAAVQPLKDCSALRAGVKSNDAVFYIFTSGTTGLPKAALISHGRYLATGRGAKAIGELGRDEVFYCFLPLFHGAALMSLFSTALACGATTVVRRKFSTSQFWNEVRKHKVTVFQYVGEICRYLTNMPEQPEEDKNTLKAIWGSGMGLDVWTKFVRRFGHHIRIFEGWGATESNGNMMNFDNKPGSCGRIPFLEFTHVRLVRFDPETESHPRDADGHLILCQPEEVGEIICQISRGDGTVVAPFEGYTNPEETRRKILDNVFEEGDRWWRSGDLMRRDADDYYYFMDRIGDTFRWKAENVSTIEVAQQLSTAYAEAEIINVYGVPVPGHEGQGGMVAVVMKQGKQFDPKKFYQVATGTLPHYAVPLFVRVCDAAHMTANFKLRKVDLRSQAFNRQLVSDPLFALSHRQQSYIPLDDEALAAMDIPVAEVSS